LSTINRERISHRSHRMGRYGGSYYHKSGYFKMLYVEYKIFENFAVFQNL
jgi:hypothetical protein